MISKEFTLLRISFFISLISGTIGQYHGLRMPNEVFFHCNAKLFGLGRRIGQQTISTHFETVSPLSMFSIIQPLIAQKTKPLNPHPKYLFGKGI